MDAKQCGCLLAVQRGSNFGSSAVGDIVCTGSVALERCYVASRKWRLRQLFEQFAADAIEPPFFDDVEIEI
jgi:hypothetical protein